MKELSIEEKAKRYDEAIEKLRSLHDDYDTVSTLINIKEELENIIPELKESEDERIRAMLIDSFTRADMGGEIYGKGVTYKQVIAWLEKQGEHANFRNNIQIGDKVTRNEDGVLVNLSQLKRVAKPSEKQCEQKPTAKVEPKFKVGDFIVNDYCMGRIVEITNDAYLLDTEQGIPFSCHSTRLWDITKDAKDGDVLSYRGGQWCFIYRGIVAEDTFKYYALLSEKGITVNDAAFSLLSSCITPATKEQRDALMKAMADAGYTFDFDKKELKKIEPKQEWSEEDMYKIENALFGTYAADVATRLLNKIKSLRPQSTWKPSDEQMEVLLSEVTAWTKGCPKQIVLESLYQDLQKLK